MLERGTPSQATSRKKGTSDRRGDALFLLVMVPISIASLAAFWLTGHSQSGLNRTIFLIAPVVISVVWLAYEQMHDLVWWRLHPLCPTCQRRFAVDERPRPGAICNCCERPLYPLRTPQDFKVVVLITAITVIALPIFTVWTSLVTRLS